MNTENTDILKNESNKMLLKYPGRIPVIVNKCEKSTLNNLKKNKFLVEKDMRFMNFSYTIRNNIQLNKSQTIFILVNNRLVNGNQTMGEIYDELKNDNGFLYVKYATENTFG